MGSHETPSIYRQLRFKAARTKLRIPQAWLQHRGLNPRDVFLGCYERSGSLWLRFVLLEILSRETAKFENVGQVIPEVHAHRKIAPVLPGGGRLIKTHEPYRSEYRRAIYLVRDLRDAMLSNYARHKEWGLAALYGADFDHYLLAFLQGRVTRFGSWQDHVNSWLDSPLVGRDDLLLVRFEDARRNPEKAVAKILDFLGITASPALVRQAIQNNSLEKMREKEDAAKKAGYAQGPLRMHRGFREDMRCVRKGAVGGWRERLTEQQLRLVDEHAGETLQRLGYPLGVSPSVGVVPVPSH